MTAPSRRARPALLVAGAGLAILLVALVAAGVGLSRREEPAQPRAAAPRVTTRDVQAALDDATPALLQRDRAAWDAALPASGGDARHGVDVLYRRLAPLPWTDLRLIAEAVRGRPGRFYVGAVGEVGDAGPADRIMARRVFDAGLRGGRVVLRDDVTPRDLRGQGVMTFARPVAVRRHGLVVIADERERPAAEALAATGATARERLELLGISASKPIVVYFYSSRRQLLRSLGEDPGEARIRFFSHAPKRLRDVPTWTRDIGVLGPALRGKASWTPRMLAHEMTHAYTSRWFEGTRNAPTLLAEGLATAVEGGRSFQPLRDDLASPESAFPLEKALKAKSLWKGNRIAKVRLAYLEGASLVLYVRDRWGLRGLREFVAAVSDSDLTSQGLDEAARRSVGVGWKALRAGWAAYVETLP
ncbi:MAG TPA: hypothetical protein VFZ86_03720 [Thermoleophilia bacterium]|nr:hypothetical protein [Thermoleophilia bacterium]